MKSIAELLASLARPEVVEFGLVTDRLPSINVGGKFEPVDDVAPSSEDVLRMLAAVGGSAHVASLSETPSQWTTQLDGIGVVSIAAMKRDDIVHARFTLAKREGRSVPPVPRAKPPSLAAPPPSSTKLRASAPVPAPKAPKPTVPKWNEDDDEPTLQTVLPAPRRAPSLTDISIPIEVELLPPRTDESDPYPVGRRGSAAEDEDVATGPVHSPSQQRLASAPPVSVDAGTTLDDFLALAIASGASDLHLAGGRPVLVRVAGELVSRAAAVGEEHVQRLVKEIVPGRLRGALERDGVCDFALDHAEHGRFRVNASRQHTGYKLSLRVIPKEVPTLGALGLRAALSPVIDFEAGLVLITGPMGHGKSSTLAALVDHLNHETARHVMTIEEPIEHLHPKRKAFLSQREVGQHSPTRARALETALWADVDTLVIGEVRDAVCARHALRASEGGRLVLATISAPTAVSAMTAFVDLLPPAEHGWARTSLASSLRWVVAQKLTRGDDGLLHVDVEIWSWSRDLDALAPNASNEREA